MKHLFFEDVAVGDEMPVLVKEPIAEVQLVKYAGASGDFNPLHTVDAVGKQAGFGGVIAHGMLVMGFIAQAVAAWIPSRCLKKFRARFSAITRPGEIITITGKVVEKKAEDNLIVCELQAKDQKGEVKINGRVEAVLQAKAV